MRAITAAEADAILNEPKVIAMNLGWKSDGRGYRLEATVMAEQSAHLLGLRAFVGVKNRSYALLFKNTPIRMFTVHDRHRDPATRQIVREPHKHRWDDVWEDQPVYVPDDIRQGDPNIELMDFLKECGITLKGTYKSQAFFVHRLGGST